MVERSLTNQVTELDPLDWSCIQRTWQEGDRPGKEKRCGVLMAPPIHALSRFELLSKLILLDILDQL